MEEGMVLAALGENRPHRDQKKTQQKISLISEKAHISLSTEMVWEHKKA